MDAKHIVKMANRSFSSTERTNQESEWAELAEFLLTNKSGNFNGESSPGSKRGRRVFDPFGSQMSHDLSAAIHATLTNPATRWSKLRFKSEELNNNKDAVSWLNNANNKIHDILNESNFDSQISAAYSFLPALGTMVLLQEQSDPEEEIMGFQFKALHLSEVAFEENNKGMVDVLYRKTKMTTKQILEEFPETAIKVLGEHYVKETKNMSDRHEIIHCIAPRERSKVKLNSSGLARGKERPYSSVYVHTKSGQTLLESGYYEFPAYVVRWSTLPGEVYGRGPGHLALSSIRTMNKMWEYKLRLSERISAPPVITEDRNLVGNIELRPNALVTVKDINRIREWQTSGRMNELDSSILALHEQVKSAFFLDKLMLPPRTETGEMTAFEVSQRTEEMQRVLGPTLSRLNTELLTPAIVRSFKMMLRAQALPPMPEVLEQRGLDIDISFVNPLARSQRIEDVTNIQGWVQDLAALAQVKPEVLDYINVDGIAKHTAQVRSIPEIAVANDDQVQEIRQQRAQIQEQQQQLDAGVKVADIASKVEGK